MAIDVARTNTALATIKTDANTTIERLKEVYPEGTQDWNFYEFPRYIRSGNIVLSWT
jgi:hypothetical protein